MLNRDLVFAPTNTVKTEEQEVFLYLNLVLDYPDYFKTEPYIIFVNKSKLDKIYFINKEGGRLIVDQPEDFFGHLED